MAISLKIGLDAISSYRRLAYTPWHAIAEFVDNSTQSYFDNKEVLDQSFKDSGEKLRVSIVYDKDDGILRVSDNSIGMSYEELEYALHVALPPKNTTGRSKYGMGLKTAACWIGNNWTIKTKKLGETTEHTVTVNVETIASGSGELPYSTVDGKPTSLHYTIVEIRSHNRMFHGRTLGKIKNFLRSMYREDLRTGVLDLEWQGVNLTWEGLDDRLLVDHEGNMYKKMFTFIVGGKSVHGWVGILDRGSRADAGFSILHGGRVVRGWPDSWRPSSLYGQLQGSNDLVNQRLVGEVHLDQFDVSHTKDDILWLGDEEEEVERLLKEHCGDYRDIALKRRKSDDDERGPSTTETDVAIDELKRELTSPEMIDRLSIDVIPTKDAVIESARTTARAVIDSHIETFRAEIADLVVKGYLAHDLSVHDPYVLSDSAKPTEVQVIINASHPHWDSLKGSEGVLNYLRHCTYDAIAEWQAQHKAATLDTDTIKYLKDKLLRVPFEMEMHAESSPQDD